MTCSRQKKTGQSRIPKLRHHKASGQAFVELSGRRFYCGKHGTADAFQRYHELVNQWLTNECRPIITDTERADATVIELLAAFKQHADAYYAGNSGSIHGFASVSRIIREHVGSIRVRDITPRHFKIIQQAMIRKGWVRSHVNKSFVRAKHIFKWGTAEGIVPPNVYHGITAISGLRRGRAAVKESQPVRPVPQADIDAVRPYVSRQVWALIQLQLLTGARAGELVMMRPIDLDTSGRVWVYQPEQHKSAIHGFERSIYIGPKAQKVIEPFLSRSLEACLFSPREADAERREQRHRDRKTPLSCGNKPGSNKVRKPKKQPGDHYNTDSYRRAIYYACDRAKVPRWSPHRLRHNAATALRRGHGIEAARVILGHRSPAVTDIYTELDSAKAIDVIGRVG